MPKPATRAYSRYSKEAVALLGQIIRLGRLERKITLAALAERAGVSRGLVQRIEHGDPGCTVGAVFELAAIVGIRLFDSDEQKLTGIISTNQKTLALLPQSVRVSRRAIKDDF